jgi:predicted transcriptional regulator of viral defense system
MLAPMNRHEPIHVTIPASAADPRIPDTVEGVVIHRVPELHPDDVTTVDGIPVTSVARTLVDLADVMAIGELRATFRRAREMGMLDIAAVRASAEWRPSLAMLHEVIDEFDR